MEKTPFLKVSVQKTLSILSKTYFLFHLPSPFWEEEGNTHLSLCFLLHTHSWKTFINAISKLWSEWMRHTEIQENSRNLGDFVTIFSFEKQVLQSLKLDWTHMFIGHGVDVWVDLGFCV